MIEHKRFFESELDAWPLAADNFRNLGLSLDGAVSLTVPEDAWQLTKVLVNHRRASLSAKIDPKSIAARPCFLCASNRPPEQGAIGWKGYSLLVNPYPLAPVHYTIASDSHEAQAIGDRIVDMAELTMVLDDLCVFYNGPLCGASAPDHMHFQAASREIAANILNPALPLIELFSTEGAKLLSGKAGAAPFPFFIIDSSDEVAVETLFRAVCASLPAAEPEPMMNVAMLRLDNGLLRTFIAPRRRHRPACYGTADGQSLISPASVEMLGTLVCSRQEDFDRLDRETAFSILREVGLAEVRACPIMNVNARAGDRWEDFYL